MKVGLLGYGKMGKMIEQLSVNYGIEVTARFDIDRPIENNEATRQILHDVPVLIEFSTPESVLYNIKIGLELRKNMVVGTTGWQKNQTEVKTWVEKAKTGFIHASNFSLGVNLFYEILSYAGKIMAKFDNYDPFVEEAHHQYKKDAPSGTALVIRELLKNYYYKEIAVSFVRAGFIPGTHIVNFDSRVDTIRLEHIARSREGFVEGALMAANWIVDKIGFYSFQEVLRDMSLK